VVPFKPHGPVGGEHPLTTDAEIEAALVPWSRYQTRTQCSSQLR
jgi:hypothetical protein